MGFLDGMFGRSQDRKPTATGRCMECGMAEGTHTDWCPGATDDASAQPTPGIQAQTTDSPDETGEATPGS